MRTEGAATAAMSPRATLSRNSVSCMIRSSSRGCGASVGLRITCRVRCSLAELRSQIRSRLRASCSRFLTVLNGSSRNAQISSYEKSLRYLSAISARSDSGKASMAFSRCCRSSQSRCGAFSTRVRAPPDSPGPSWLTVLGQGKDSLWSSTRSCCEWAGAAVRTGCSSSWTMRASIVGFGVHRGAVDGAGLRRMFNRATHGQFPLKYLSSDHDPLYGPAIGRRTCAYSTSRKSRRCRTHRSRIPSLTADWHHSARMSGPHPLLDDGRSGDEAPRFQLY